MRAPGAEAKVWPSIPGRTFQVAVITGGERSKTCGFTVQGKPAAEPGLARGEPALKLYLFPPLPSSRNKHSPDPRRRPPAISACLRREPIRACPPDVAWLSKAHLFLGAPGSGSFCKLSLLLEMTN